MMRSDPTGSIAVTILIALSFVAVLLAATMVYVGHWYVRVPRELERDRLHRRLDATLQEALSQLASDPTPQSSSPVDPVWSWVASTHGSDTVVRIEDVSSRIDPNWIRPGVFDKTGLSELFASGASVQGGASAALQQYREDHGFFMDLSKGYGSFFSNRTIRKYLTPWSYANLNTSDEFALRKLYEVRTGEEAAAEVFHQRVQQLLMQKRIVGETQLRSVLQGDYVKLFPVVNALPWWNVHYVPELILRQILAYPAYHISDGAGKADELLSLRRSGEITPQQLRQIIGLPAAQVIYQYLGTITWFWKISVTCTGDAAATDAAATDAAATDAAGSSGSLVAVVCRLPSDAVAANAPASEGASANGISSGIHFKIVFRRCDP